MERVVRYLERMRTISIALFVGIVVIVGILLIVCSQTYFKGTPLEFILASLGSTLIGVGLVDVVSEVFISPGVISKITQTLHKSFPSIFIPPETMEKSVLTTRIKEFVKALCPVDQIKDEYLHLFEKVFIEQFKEIYREDLGISIKLRKRTITEISICEATVEVEYKVHNATDKKVDYKIPMYFSTYSFVEKGIPIEDHIKLEKITVTRGTEQPEDVGQAFGVYSVSPVEKSPLKVELVLPRYPTYEISPRDNITVFFKYKYLADLIDDHTQRIVNVTRNLKVHIDYSEEEFFVDLDDFCMMDKKTISPGHSYEWDGWFLPRHGFCIEWKPKSDSS